MKKGKKITIKINLSNRWLYTLIIIGILVVIGVGVYALTPGVLPTPGHLISDLAPPSGCTANQVLQWTGTAWICVNLPVQSVLSGTMMGGYIIQYIWGPGQSYGGFTADGAINVNGAGLGLITTRCGGNYGVASSCTCPAGYSARFIPGGVGDLQGEFTSSSSCGGKASCVITNFAVFCIKT